jgi:hypothetical protein
MSNEDRDRTATTKFTNATKNVIRTVKRVAGESDDNAGENDPNK